jgi:RNA polymerase sigma factor (sigma-70 family)
MAPLDPAPADDDLVARARAGSEEAFLALVTRYKGIVAGSVFVLVRDAREAEEIAGDAFAEAWRALEQLRDAFAFGGWVRKIARRLALRRIKAASEERARARGRRAAGAGAAGASGAGGGTGAGGAAAVLASDPWAGDGPVPALPAGGRVEDVPAGPEADPAALLQIRDLYERIALEMQRLPSCYRDVVGLRYFGGLAMKEIAATLGIPVGTVTMRLTRGSRMLRARLSTALKDYLEA